MTHSVYHVDRSLIIIIIIIMGLESVSASEDVIGDLGLDWCFRLVDQTGFDVIHHV